MTEMEALEKIADILVKLTEGQDKTVKVLSDLVGEVAKLEEAIRDTAR